MLEHFVFSSRIYFSSSLRWITIPYFRERFLFLCLSISLSFLDIAIVLTFTMPFPARFLKQKCTGGLCRTGLHFCGLGGQGDMPSASANIQIPMEGKLDVCPPAYIRRQCLLFVANYPQGICVLCELRRASYNTYGRFRPCFCKALRIVGFWDYPGK